VPSKTSGTPVYNPSTGDVIAECPVGSAAEAKRGRRGRGGRISRLDGNAGPSRRARILGKFKMLMEENFEGPRPQQHSRARQDAGGIARRT